MFIPLLVNGVMLSRTRMMGVGWHIGAPSMSSDDEQKSSNGPGTSRPAGKLPGTCEN